jgi:4-amino-4-deoxy-L-arabinose transferase-like glycosyltransferase
MSARQSGQDDLQPTVVAESPPDEHVPGSPLSLRVAIIAVVLLGASVLLFGRLGHYALWDDETLTAIPALGLWRTGDTTFVLGRNILAFRNGSMLTNLSDRCSPPLMFALAAPSLGLFGQTAWAARFPFALCGLGTVALLLLWAWRARADAATWILLGLAILGNVSFYLYSRQCRYYAPTILLTVSVAYGYVFHDGRRGWLLALSLLSAALLATNPMNYVALYAAIAVDYALWARKRQALGWTGWLWLFLPQVLLGAPILAVWNPSHTKVFTLPHEN